MRHIYAGVLGLLAFVTVVARGVVHSAGTQATLLQASLALMMMGAVGYVIGRLAEWIVEDSVRTTLAAELAEQEAGREETSAAST